MTKEEILESMTFHNKMAVNISLEKWQRKVHYQEYFRYERMLKEMGFKRTTKGWV